MALSESPVSRPLKLSTRGGRAVLAVSVMLAAAQPAIASADSNTHYMVTRAACSFDCTVVVMQVKGSKLRFKMAAAQSGGIGSIGWMMRSGDKATGMVGGDCSMSRQTRSVVGSGARTRFPGMRIVTRAQAQQFAYTYRDMGVMLPDWPWQSRRDWEAAYERMC